MLDIIRPFLELREDIIVKNNLNAFLLLFKRVFVILGKNSLMKKTLRKLQRGLLNDILLVSDIRHRNEKSAVTYVDISYEKTIWNRLTYVMVFINK